MGNKKLSISDLREYIRKGEVTDPLVFLESIMIGQDPRCLSSIYELILEIQDFTNGDIGPSEWNEIVNHVQDRYKYKAVTLNESTQAAKTLSEYLHPKRKQIDIGDANGENGHAGEHPLTEEEIDLFKEKFNDEFW